MASDEPTRRRVLQATGVSLAALTGVAQADECIRGIRPQSPCDGGGGGGGGGGGCTTFAVETDAAFPGTGTTTLRGDLQCLASHDSAECYFEYKRSSSSVYSNSASVTRSSTGLYDVDIATTTHTTYDFRAVAEAPDGTTVRGGVLTFQTGDGTSE